MPLPIVSRSRNVSLGIGKEIGWELTKGKAGTHEGKKGTFKYYFDPPEIDIDFDFMTGGNALEAIRRGGSVYYIDHDGELDEIAGEAGTIKYQGKGDLLRALDEDPRIKNYLWKKMLRLAGLQHVRHRDL